MIITLLRSKFYVKNDLIAAHQCCAHGLEPLARLGEVLYCVEQGKLNTGTTVLVLERNTLVLLIIFREFGHYLGAGV